MQFKAGDFVRRAAADWGDVRTGKVYQIAALCGTYTFILVGSEIEYSTDFFVPFKWQAGDAFVIVKTGFCLGPIWIGKKGRLIEKKEYYWKTDQPGILGTLEAPLCVMEEQILPLLGNEEQPPAGDELLKLKDGTPLMPVAPAKKPIRFINRKEST